MIRVPLDVARSTGLSEGEPVEVEARDSDILICCRAAHAESRHLAEIAATEILAGAKGHRLGGRSIRELRKKGRCR